MTIDFKKDPYCVPDNDGHIHCRTCREAVASARTSTDIKLPLERTTAGIFTPESLVVWDPHVTCLERAYAELQGRCVKAEEAYRTHSVTEIAASNPSVLDYCKHWEGRAEKAEKERHIAEFEAAHAQQDRDRAEKERDEARAELSQVKAAFVDGLGSCTCGCPDDAHEFVDVNWRECGKDDCGCQPCSPAVAAVVAQLRAEVERLKAEKEKALAEAELMRSRPGVKGYEELDTRWQELVADWSSAQWRVGELTREVERLKEQLVEQKQAMSEALGSVSAMAIAQDLEDRAAMRTENKRLKRIEAAQLAWERVDPVKHRDAYTDACGDPSYVAAEIGAGRGPDDTHADAKEEVKP